MAAAHSNVIEQYQQSIWGPMDRALKNCFVGSGILGLIVLIIVFVAPALPPKPTTMEQVPERLARGFHLVQNLFRVLQQLFARLGEHDLFAQPVQKATADITFERLHRVADA